MPDPIIVTTGGPIQPPVPFKTILEVIREVCPVIGISVPSSVFSGTDREQIELQSLANEMAARIAIDTRDWTKLKILATFEGDGVTEGFDLPSDYGRMLKTTRVWPSSQLNSPLTHYPDTDEWYAAEIRSPMLVFGAWTLIGEQMLIKPPMAEGASVGFYYLSNLYAASLSGENKPTFTDDTDHFRLDNRVLKLGMIWQWKANKGFPYAEDMKTYEDALAVQAGADKGGNILTVGRVTMPADAYAYPFPVGR